MSDKKGLCVLGSLNIDQTVRVSRFPVAGETVSGSGFATFTGGKGGNQAVAAARLGAQTRMVACVGGDLYGDMYLNVLRGLGVETTHVSRLEGETTGTAVIEVADSGENRIIVVAGANGALTAARVDEARAAIERSAYLLMQLETPLEGVTRAAEIARASGTLVLLDPAPARPLPDALLKLCDYVTPNETELKTLTGLPAGTDEEALAACRALLERGVGAVLHKRGARGSMLVDRNGVTAVPAFAVKAVDTTAAGDTFNAAFAAGLDSGLPVPDAMRLANAAAGLSTTALGAQTAMPTLDQALALIKTGRL